MWKSEKLHAGYEQRFFVKKVLCTEKSKFQKVEIIDTPLHGKVLLLDDIVQLTEKDEYIYHEMLTHISMFSHKNPKKVLVLGGGDGGIIREVLKHPVDSVTMVEIDEKVISLSKKHLKKVSNGAFDDSRLKLIVGDAAEFVKNTTDKFDVIITDRGDEVGPGHPLFAQSFYQNCAHCLVRGGIFTSITGVANMQPAVVKNTVASFKEIFKYHGQFLIYVPMYIGGSLVIAWGSDSQDISKISLTTLQKRVGLIQTKYYNAEMHKASFTLPTNLQKS